MATVRLAMDGDRFEVGRPITGRVILRAFGEERPADLTVELSTAGGWAPLRSVELARGLVVRSEAEQDFVFALSAVGERGIERPGPYVVKAALTRDDGDTVYQLGADARPVHVGLPASLSRLESALEEVGTFEREQAGFGAPSGVAAEPRLRFGYRATGSLSDVLDGIAFHVAFLQDGSVEGQFEVNRQERTLRQHVRAALGREDRMYYPLRLSGEVLSAAEGEDVAGRRARGEITALLRSLLAPHLAGGW